MLGDYPANFLQHWHFSDMHFFWLNLEHCHNNQTLLSFLLPADHLYFEGSQSRQKSLEQQWSRALLRAALNTLYGAEISVSPIAYGPHGKPYLESTCGVSFNLSHSRGHVFLGLTSHGFIGVDIERGLNSLQRCELLAKRVLSLKESSVFLGLKTAPEKIIYFNRVWNSKEALLKCLGIGISTALTEIDILGTYAPSHKFESFTRSSLEMGLRPEFNALLIEKSGRQEPCFESIRFDFVCFDKSFADTEMMVCFKAFKTV